MITQKTYASSRVKRVPSTLDPILAKIPVLSGGVSAPWCQPVDARISARLKHDLGHSSTVNVDIECCMPLLSMAVRP